MQFCACKNMGWFTPNNETEQEEDGEYEIMLAGVKQKLGNLECEEAVLKDKERFGRVRTSNRKLSGHERTTQKPTRTIQHSFSTIKTSKGLNPFFIR